MSTTDAILEFADSELQNSLDRLFQFIRIASVSADPAHAGDCRRAAAWAVDLLGEIGFDASVRQTAGLPMVVAHYRTGRPDARRALFYGHYDVQPADPVALWQTPPFEPQLVDNEEGQVIAARGASDDKGQVMTFIEACRAMIKVQGTLPIDITILLEGEEESGSTSLEAFVIENRDELSADLCLVCDTCMWDAQTPAVTTMLRGMVYEEVMIAAADVDLHSGMFGGAAQNPIRVLSNIIAGLHNDDGRVTLPGFYDGVRELSDAMKQSWQALKFDGAGFLGGVGLAVPAGEVAYSILEQITVRPTCDVNGIIAGYTGDGAKTVIPATASAKISFRLVGQQDPDAVQAAFRAFVESRLPADCGATFLNHGKSRAVSIPAGNVDLARVRNALTDEWQRETVLIGTGGSIPVIGAFQRILGLDALLIGFALDNDRVHSPNERYAVRRFHKGIRSWTRVLQGLA
jgi:acetylornithine deacetylase/succinyl-diaminopimelate desuccinylase-like protein